MIVPFVAGAIGAVVSAGSLTHARATSLSRHGNASRLISTEQCNCFGRISGQNVTVVTRLRFLTPCWLCTGTTSTFAPC
jgi:hypothetical protein